jgi:hypothetical protein
MQNFFKKHWFTIVLLVAVIILSLILFNGCNAPTGHEQEKKQVDSLEKVITTNNLAASQKINALEQNSQQFFDAMQTAEGERSKLSVALQQSKARAQALQKRLFDGNSSIQIGGTLVIDTSLTYFITNCDSLSNEFTTYRSIAESELNNADTVIDKMNNYILNQDSIILIHQKTNAQLDSAFHSVTTNYDHLYTDFSKQVKANQRHKTKEKILLGVAGALLITTITSFLK